MGKEPFRQPPLPGMDPLTRHIDALHASQLAEQQLRKHLDSEQASVYAIQNLIAGEYKREILSPRQQIWEDTIGFLNTISPDKLSFSGAFPQLQQDMNQTGKFMHGEGTWKVQKVVTRPDYDAKVAINISAHMGMPVNEDTAAEIQTAFDYIHSHDKKKLREYDKLLGVPVEGHLRWKRISEDALRDRLKQILLSNTRKLAVSVEADLLNGTSKESVLQFEVENKTFDPIRTLAIERDQRYLLSENVEVLYEAMKHGRYSRNQHGWEPTERNPNPSLKDIEAWLRKVYIEAGIGPTFESLNAVNLMLEQ